MCLGIPGKVVEFLDAPGMKMAKVDFGGVIRAVCVEALPELKIGEYVIVHAGFALNQLSEQEAFETLEILKEISDIDQEIL